MAFEKAPDANTKVIITADFAASHKRGAICPVCGEEMLVRLYPKQSTRYYFYCPKGHLFPFCEDVEQGRNFDLQEGLDELFRIHEKGKTRGYGPVGKPGGGPGGKPGGGPGGGKRGSGEIDNLNPRKEKIRTLKQYFRSPQYFLYDPFEMVNGIPAHRIILLRKKCMEKMKAWFGMPSKADAIVGCDETNGKFLVECRIARTQHYDDCDEECILEFQTSCEIQGVFHHVYWVVTFKDETMMWDVLESCCKMTKGQNRQGNKQEYEQRGNGCTVIYEATANMLFCLKWRGPYRSGNNSIKFFGRCEYKSEYAELPDEKMKARRNRNMTGINK